MEFLPPDKIILLRMFMPAITWPYGYDLLENKSMSHCKYLNPETLMILILTILSFIFFPYFSLDSEFLASTSTDGSARIWKIEDGVPLTTLSRNSVWCIWFKNLGQDLYAVLVLLDPNISFCLFRMKRLNYVDFPRMEPNHFYFALFKKV